MSEIPWVEWGDAAFARARAEQKPILLHIGATWCHWCHVMDQGTYTHPVVARLMNERFVNVRVDTDHRPDVNERYNMGGWPTVAILDADGEVLTGRTWVPPQEFAQLLQSVSEPGQRWSIGASAPDPVPTASVPVEAIWEAVRKGFDPYHGGFGDLQKFPHTAVCEWILDRRLSGDDDGAMLTRSLDGMAGHGMYDHGEGGFFRYATQDDWSEPHYEKMLEDTARLVALYTRAAVATGNAAWERAAQRAVSWALKHLWDDVAGAFGGSQDADEAYYAAPPGQRGAPPFVDRTIYAGWNGLMATALVRAAAAWERPGLGALALRVGELLRARIDPAGCVSRTGAGIGGLLSDQAEVAEALLSLHQYTGDRRWRDDAARAVGWAAAHLRSPDGGFYDRLPGGLGLLRHPRRPLIGNALLAEVCWRLGALGAGASGAGASGARWGELAGEAAAAALGEAENWGFLAANAACAAERIARPPVVVKVCESPALLAAFLADAHPEVMAVAIGRDEGVAPGHAMACSGSACARPGADLAELRRGVRMLMGRPDR